MLATRPASVSNPSTANSAVTGWALNGEKPNRSRLAFASRRTNSTPSGEQFPRRLGNSPLLDVLSLVIPLDAHRSEVGVVFEAGRRLEHHERFRRAIQAANDQRRPCAIHPDGQIVRGRERESDCLRPVVRPARQLRSAPRWHGAFFDDGSGRRWSSGRLVCRRARCVRSRADHREHCRHAGNGADDRDENHRHAGRIWFGVIRLDCCLVNRDVAWLDVVWLVRFQRFHRNDGRQPWYRHTSAGEFTRMPAPGLRKEWALRLFW